MLGLAGGGGLGVGEVGRVGERVDESGVDAGEARGVGVAEPGDLEGRGRESEGGEAVAGEEAGEFDDDLDVVVADEAGEGGLGEARGVEPEV